MISDRADILCRKALNFDLDTNSLGQYFTPYNRAYFLLERELKHHDFIHTQGSGYISKEPITDLLAMKKILNVVNKYPWFLSCAKTIHLTNVDDNALDAKANIANIINSQNSTLKKPKNNQLTVQASQFWAFEKTTIGKKLHDGFTILSNPENQWFLLKDGLPKANGAELSIGDKTTIDDVVAQYSSESRKDMITRFDGKQDAIDYWHKHSAEYSAMREKFPKENENTRKTQDIIDELLPAEFKPKASGSSSSSGRDERGH